MVSKTRRKEKSRKLGSLLPSHDQFDIEEITHVIGNTANRQSSEDEGDFGRNDQVAFSATRLDESTLFNKLSWQVDTESQEGLFQSLSQLEDRLELAIESLHKTISCSVGTMSHHSGKTNDPPNSWGLDQNSFELRSEVTLNQIEIGDILDFRLTLRPAGDPDEDTLIFEISASYNGYSCLIFCGDPEISFSDVMDPEKYTYSRYGVTYDKVFEGISYDSYVYDFGTVNPLPGEQIIVDFKMLVADNPQYTPQTQYWMGVGVEYNNSRSIWVNDIAFTLADRPVRSYNFSLCPGEESNLKNPKPKAINNKIFQPKYHIKSA